MKWVSPATLCLGISSDSFTVEITTELFFFSFYSQLLGMDHAWLTAQDPEEGFAHQKYLMNIK